MKNYVKIFQGYFTNNLAVVFHFTTVWSVGYHTPPKAQIQYAKWDLRCMVASWAGSK